LINPNLRLGPRADLHKVVVGQQQTSEIGEVWYTVGLFATFDFHLRRPMRPDPELGE
jgi:hypothetical protein